MNSIRSIARKLLGLVIDDWRLACAIIVWLAAVWLVAPPLQAAGTAGCVALFAGLSIILTQSAWQAARHRRQARSERQRSK